MLDKKIRGINEAFVGGYPDIFDKDVFSNENIEWALLTVESRLQFINYEGVLFPMYDLVSFGVNPNDKTKQSNHLYENEKITIKAITSFESGQEIFDHPSLQNERLLISYGRITKDSPEDCFGINLSYTTKKEDQLAKKRVEFFSKYFLYDQGHIDMM